MKNFTKIIALLLLNLSFYSCAAPSDNSSKTADSKNVQQAIKTINDPIKCSNPRPQICTREYQPVCATKDTGIRCIKAPCPSQELKTYANACNACADQDVASYTLGKCEK